MKRSYSDMTLSLLPKWSINDPKLFKSTLEGTYTLFVTKVIDISKPSEKPIDEIEEPEEDEVARQNKLNRGNARMLQLFLKDSENTEICAVEFERIEKLTTIKPNCLINLVGPLEIRCRNIMLRNTNVTDIKVAPKEETTNVPKSEVQQKQTSEPVYIPPQAPVPKVEKPDMIVLDEDWDEDDEEDCIILD